jgi:hypothetical protein
VAYGQLWPAHPKPLPEELLSSWFVRVAASNGIKLQTLSHMLFGGGRSPWHRDVDRAVMPWFVDVVCAHTGLPLQTAHGATLESYCPRLYPRVKSSGPLRWVLPIMGEGMSRRGFGVQFCPACLTEDAIPYFRKPWRIALFTFCLKHSCALHDACPGCGAPVAYFRHDFSREISASKGLACCSVCGVDFRAAKRAAAMFPTDDLRNFVESMLRSVEFPEPSGSQFDQGFFAVLHQLCRIVGTHQNAGKLLQYAASELGMPATPIALGRTSIEQRRRDERHQSLLCGAWLVADPEKRLRAAWEAKAVRYNLLIKDFDDPPPTYLSLVKTFLRGANKSKPPPEAGAESQQVLEAPDGLRIAASIVRSYAP